MESKRVIGKSGLKNALIIFFAATTIAAGYIAYDRNQLSDSLEAQVSEMEVKLDYNAMETQMAYETFAEIENNLSTIRQREGYVLSNLNPEEFKGDANAEDRIQAEIETIELLIDDNKKLIGKLTDEVGQKDGRLAEYQRSVSSLQKRITDYKARTQELAEEANMLRADLVSVQGENQAITQELALKEFVVAAQSHELDRREEELRTGYYAVGTFKELRDEEVVEKKGGILGIAAVKSVKEDFNRDRFTRIDIYDNTTIPVFSPGAEVVSNHDSNSYEFVEADRETRWIKITDPELFWENTKYLVVVTKGEQYRPSTAQAGL